jgi:putative membrane protein
MVTAYALFALAEVGLEIENPWGEGPNDLDLDRYCNLLRLDLDGIMAHPQTPGALGVQEVSASSSRTVLSEVASGYGTFVDGADTDLMIV